MLYRAVSKAEKTDYEYSGIFRTGKNTLEAKQFFQSEPAVLEFALEALSCGYIPAYA